MISVNPLSSEAAACKFSYCSPMTKSASLNSPAGLCCVLGLATGSSPTQVYKWLVRWHREGALSFWNVITFNLVSFLLLGHT